MARRTSDMLISKLADFIDLMLRREPNGLAILLGTVPPPSAEELYQLGQGSQPDYGVRIQGGKGTPTAEAIIFGAERFEFLIEEIGGWEKINRALRIYRDKYPVGWNLLEEHALFVKQGGLFHDGQGGMMAVIAKKHGDVTARTIRNRRNTILTIIARFVIYWFPEDEEYQLFG